MRRGLQPSSAGLIFSKDSPPFQRSVDTPMNFKLLVMLTLLFTATCVLAGNDDDEVRKLTGSWSLSLNSNDKLAFWVTVRVCGGPGASSWQARGTTTRHRPGQYKREPGQGSLAS